MYRIRSFRGFIVHIILLLLAIVAIVFIVIGIPILYLSSQGLVQLPISPETLITNPSEVIKLYFDLMKTPAFADFFRVSVFPGFTFVSLFAAAIILWERKLLAKIQMRIGPLYAGKLEGVLQPIADFLKLIFKELIVPKGADKPLFWAAPTAGVAVATASIVVIPLSEQWVVARSSVGLLLIFAIIGFFPIIVLLAGWASNSKYPLIGGLRALHQMISYEIPLVISALSVTILSGSLDLIEIVKAQADIWYVLPLAVGAFTFYTCSLAELERIPFDLPEAESEIVTGWLTEYTGINYGLIYGIAAYIKFYTLAALFTTIFLGGWMGPPFLPPEAWFVIKLFIVSTLFILPRGVYPRIRIDLMLRKGWFVLLILSILNIFIALGWVYAGLFIPEVRVA